MFHCCEMIFTTCMSEHSVLHQSFVTFIHRNVLRTFASSPANAQRPMSSISCRISQMIAAYRLGSRHIRSSVRWQPTWDRRLAQLWRTPCKADVAVPRRSLLDRSAASATQPSCWTLLSRPSRRQKPPTLPCWCRPATPVRQSGHLDAGCHMFMLATIMP